jgi:serine/threonine protein kinase
MVSAKGIVKLTDLGSAVFIDDNYVIEGFSRWYKAPELLMGSKSYDY